MMDTNNNWAAILVLAFLGVSFLPNIVSAGVSAEAITVTLIHTQKFPKPVIDYQLDKNAQGDVYPNVLKTAEAINILDPNGKVLASLPNHGDPANGLTITVLSAGDKNHVALLVRDESGQKYGEYDIFDKNGDKTLQIKPFNRIVVGPYPSPSGDYAVGWANIGNTPGGPPIFYDAKGIRNKWAKNFSGQGWPKGYATMDAYFSPGGNQVIVIATQGSVSDRTLAYNAQGNLLWTQADGYSSAFSPNGQEIAQGYDYYFQDPNNGFIRMLAAATGKILWADKLAKGEAPSIFKFTPDGQWLTAATTQGNLYLFNANNGDVVWRWNVSSLPNIPKGFELDGIYGLAATSDLNTIAAAVRTKKSNSGSNPIAGDDYLVFLSKQGQVVSTIVLPPNSFTLRLEHGGGIAPLSFSADGKQLSLMTQDGLRTYQINAN